MNTADHVATMVNALADASREGQELHVITSDIQKALREALVLHGYPPELVRRVTLLRDMCTNASGVSRCLR